MLAWTLAGCAGELDVRSAAFEDGGAIPVEHTCDGEDRSPPLSWSGVPPEADSLAMIVEDPDAPGGKVVIHWLWWGLDASAGGLPEGVPADAAELVQGTSSMGPPGWFGPCPPRGDGPHRYRFRLYATRGVPDLAPTATADDLRAELDVVAEGLLTGTYGRD